MNNKLILVALVASLAVAGCSSRGDKRQTGADSRSTTPTQQQGPATAPAPRSGALATSQASGVSGISERVIFFDFDSAQIRADGMAIVEEWAAYLTRNPNARVRLEGHADERGTREYNVALGERRANAVQQALVARGVNGGQLTVVSFGEERPVTLGHDETAWSKNRRVEIVD